MYFDVIILGSGSGGYIAAIRSSQLGMKTAIIESEKLGGTSLHLGSIPIKSILDSAKNISITKNNKDILYHKNIKINISNIIENSKNAIRIVKNEIDFLMKKYNISVIYGNVQIKKNKKIIVIRESYKKEFYAKNIIIATGYIPNFNKWYNGKNIITIKEALVLKKIPKNIIILGTTNIGIELAYFYNCIGSKVIIIEKKSIILEQEDHEISKYLENYFNKIGITIYTSSYINIKQVEDVINLDIVVKNKCFTINTEFILDSNESTPNINNIGLDKIGMQIDDGLIVVNDNYQTNISGYYAIGDVIKKINLPQVYYYEAIHCVEFIKGLDFKKIDYNNIPKCIYSDPEIASVGYTEQEANKRGFKLKISKLSFDVFGKIIAKNNIHGFIKIIFDNKYDELLGCHLIGNEASYIISEIVVAKKLETTSDELLNSIHIYPSLSESIVEAISISHKKSIHF